MNNTDKEYLRILKELCDKAETIEEFKEDRTGTGTISIFGPQIKFNFDEGFPILTTKNVYFKAIKTELLWFLGLHLQDKRYADLGITNIRYLLDNNVHIWDEWPFQDYLKKNNLDSKFYKHTEKWKEEMKGFCEKVQTDDEFAKKYGTIGYGYGKQWTEYSNPIICDGEGWYDEGINQIEYIINELETNPDSRRMLVNAWNVSELDDITLLPCHYSFQLYTTIMNEKERAHRWCKEIERDQSYCSKLTHAKMDEIGVPTRSISLLWNQRSCDYFLGIPFNITSYALLLSIIGNEVNMFPDELIGNFGDCHLYSNHLEQAKEQLSREIKYKLPKLSLKKQLSDDGFNIDDIKLVGYKKDKTIKAPIAV